MLYVVHNSLVAIKPNHPFIFLARIAGQKLFEQPYFYVSE